MSELWTEKFFPNSIEEFVGNSEIVKKALEWGEKWQNGKKPKPLLLHGQTGAGKTCLAILLARKHDWQLFEMNASDLRNKDAIERIAGSAARNSLLYGTKRLVLIDEVDCFQSIDKGGMQALAKILQESENPVVLTANNIYSDKKLQAIRPLCDLLEFKKINYLSIAKTLRELCEKEGIVFEKEAVELLAKNSNGDYRSALLDLQTLALEKNISLKDVEETGFRERQENIFKMLREILLAKTSEEVFKAREKVSVSNDLLEKWIEENIPRQFKDNENIARMFERLSKADIFNGRIMRRQKWELLKYSIELMTSGVAMAKTKEEREFIIYQFPALLSKLSRSQGQRAFKKELGKKIGSKTHSSSKKIIEELEYLKQTMQASREKAIQFAVSLDLNKEELAFLLGKKEDSAIVKKLFEETEKIKKKAIMEKREFFPRSEAIAEELESEEEQKTENPIIEEKTQTSLHHYFKK